MNNLVRTLASLKLTVALLVLVLLVLAVGTIVESRTSAEAARQAVYYSWWFIGLQVVFAVNVIASIANLFPWGKARIGFLVVHGGIVAILIGATVSYFFKTEGQLGLWEGGTGNVIENVDIATGEHSRHELPFQVTLDDFQIDRYQGTMRPAMFRSKVRVTDPVTSETFAAEIWMNNPLRHRGYTLFQSSYQQQGGREASIFSVSKDPGQTIAFVGYGLLVIGMCWVFGTRIAAHRRARSAEELARAAGAGLKRVAAAIVLAAAFGGSASAADSVESLRRLPVQHDGRVMPLDTLAREAVKAITGSSSLHGEDQVATMAQWLAAPAAAAQVQVIRLPGRDFAAAIGMAGQDFISFAQLVDNQRALRLFSQARAMAQQEQRRTGLLADAEKLEERAGWLRRVLDGEAVLPVPCDEGHAGGAWHPPTPANTAALLSLATGPRLEGWPSPSDIEREITYNAVRPGRVAWIVLLLSLVLSLAAWKRRSRPLDVAAFAALAAGFGVMTWGIAVRWAIGDRIPAANMYESMLFLAWGVGLFAVVAFAFIRNRLLVVNASAMSAITMLLIDLLPMDGFIHPVPPVLSGTPWLAIHVPLTMVGYSVLALALFIAHMQLVYSAFAPRRTETIGKMYDLLYWYIHVGNILLVAGILTGSIWAAESWGRYWGWDPKEVWSLVAFLAYMAILHAKVERLIGRFGVAAISVIAFQTVLMTYLGVNYVLGTGLHSYGFGDSPIVTWMVGVALVEVAFVVGCWVKYRSVSSDPVPVAA
jgi:cytochrome c-type biogenesis protein CcsB